jgi:hypothetical protein
LRNAIGEREQLRGELTEVRFHLLETGGHLAVQLRDRAEGAHCSCKLLERACLDLECAHARECVTHSRSLVAFRL